MKQVSKLSPTIQLLIASAVLSLSLPINTAKAGLLDRVFGDSCTEYSDFTCDELEHSSYKVYFFYPNRTDEYLGQSHSLTECNSMAVYHANKKDLGRYDDWGYICCLIANGSSCYEKHR